MKYFLFFCCTMIEIFITRDSIRSKGKNSFVVFFFFLRKEALLWTLYAISPENSVLLKKRLQWCPIVIGNKAMRPTFSTRETINHEFQL